jgi:MFS family permease
MAEPLPAAPSPAAALHGARSFDGWRIVALAGIAQALGYGLLGAYGFLATPLIEEFGATPSQLGLGYSVSIFVTALVGPLVGWLLDRGPLRVIMLSGVALMLGSVLALSRGTALGTLAAWFALTSIGMATYGTLSSNVMIVNWFILRRGTALALASAGASVGAFLVPQVSARLIDRLGWRGAVAALACGAAAIAAPLIARFAVKRPEEVGQHPDGDAAPQRGRAGAPALVEIPVGRLLRDANFWRIGIGYGIAMGVLLPAFFLVPYMERELGIPRPLAANVPSTAAACALIGKLVAGRAIDLVDKRVVVSVALCLHALGWVLAATQSSLAGMLVAAVPLGLGAGSFMPLPAVLQGACFGRAMIGRVTGLGALLALPFLLSAAPLVGWFAERTGGFAPPFCGLAAALVLAAAVLALVRIPKLEPGL